jgi:hypothetical protein
VRGRRTADEGLDGDARAWRRKSLLNSRKFPNMLLQQKLVEIKTISLIFYNLKKIELARKATRWRCYDEKQTHSCNTQQIETRKHFGSTNPVQNEPLSKITSMETNVIYRRLLLCSNVKVKFC